MSLVTRCPACHTKFKVVRDQLRISDGWVRCGRCSEVFDASLNLRETPDEGAPAPADAPATPVASEADPFVAKTPSPPLAPSPPEPFWPARDLLDLEGPQRSAPPPARKQPTTTEVPFFGLIADEPWPSPPPAAAVPPPPSPPPAAATVPPRPVPAAPAPTVPVPTAPAPASDLAHAALPLRPSAPSQAPAADVPLQKALRRARAKAAKIAKSREKKEAASQPGALGGGPGEPEGPRQEEVPPLPSFLESRARWRPASGVRPRVLIAIALLAAVLLALQVLRHERDVLAARQPGLRPLLSQLCALTGCQVAALRRIGSITIDGAAFSRERIGEGYRLSFTLRNDAAMPLAMPAIELSLLDTQERAVVRRVLQPADFGAPPVLGANAERAASLALSLTGAEAAVLPPVAGYRVVAFYP